MLKPTLIIMEELFEAVSTSEDTHVGLSQQVYDLKEKQYWQDSWPFSLWSQRWHSRWFDYKVMHPISMAWYAKFLDSFIIWRNSHDFVGDEDTHLGWNYCLQWWKVCSCWTSQTENLGRNNSMSNMAINTCRSCLLRNQTAVSISWMKLDSLKVAW